MRDMRRTYVLLFTDEPALSKGFVDVLSSDSEFFVLPVIDSIRGLVETLKAAVPDIILLDLTPEITNEIIIELQRLVRDSKLVLWLRSISPDVIQYATRLGVSGVLLKNLSPEMLVKCLQKLAAGEHLLEAPPAGETKGIKRVGLSRRETQLISLLAQGMKNKEIANALFLSEGTVKVYLSRLFQKTGAKDRFELALYGVKQRALGSPIDRRAFARVPPQFSANRELTR
jgi:DNA-binding NarL/FixJ family response regulator